MAHQTFSESFKHPEKMKFFKWVMKTLRKISKPDRRARKAHQLVDESINELVRSEPLAERISCRKKCTSCCYTQVAVNSDEAELLFKKIKEQKIEIDKDLLSRQAFAGLETRSWYQLSHSQRSCVFLDLESGECRVYDSRPNVCRTNLVLSNPDSCSTLDGRVKPQRHLRTDKADLITVASFHVSETSGTLPFLLKKLVDRDH